MGLETLNDEELKMVAGGFNKFEEAYQAKRFGRHMNFELKGTGGASD
mgnify:CR=1 FL=1